MNCNSYSTNQIYFVASYKGILLRMVYTIHALTNHHILNDFLLLYCMSPPKISSRRASSAIIAAVSGSLAHDMDCERTMPSPRLSVSDDQALLTKLMNKGLHRILVAKMFLKSGMKFSNLVIYTWVKVMFQTMWNKCFAFFRPNDAKFCPFDANFRPRQNQQN